MKMKFLCNHNYEIIKEHELKSQMQFMIENGLESAEMTPRQYMFISKYMIVYKCSKCNKIKETVITNKSQ